MSVAEADAPQPGEERSCRVFLDVISILTSRELDGVPSELIELTECDLRRLRHNIHVLMTTAVAIRAGRSRQAEKPAYAHLTAREREILVELQWHQSVHTIARSQHVSDNTIKTHLLSIYRKLDAHERSDAVARARQLGLL